MNRPIDRRKQRHHFIPKFILKRFTDESDKRVAVYDKLTRQTRRQGLRKIAQIPGLNTHPRGGCLEDVATDFDTIGAERLRKLEDGALLPSDSEDFSGILGFLAYMVVRNPKHLEITARSVVALLRAKLAADETGENQWFEMASRLSDCSVELPDSVPILPDEDLALDTRSVWREAMRLLPILESTFRGLGWHALRSDGCFVIGDCPVDWLNPRADVADYYGQALKRISTEVVAVVSPNLALVGHHKRVDISLRYDERDASPSEIKIINSRQIASARREVYAKQQVRQRNDYLSRYRLPLLG